MSVARLRLIKVSVISTSSAQQLPRLQGCEKNRIVSQQDFTITCSCYSSPGTNPRLACSEGFRVTSSGAFHYLGCHQAAIRSSVPKSKATETTGWIADVNEEA